MSTSDDYSATRLHDSRSLEGRVILITGGSSGIGLATARLFLEEGAAVAIVGRNPERMSDAVAKLAVADRVEPVIADVSSVDEGARAVSTTVERFGALDYVFCNAGIPGVGLVDEIQEDVWDQVMAVNVKGIYTIVRAAVPHLKARSPGAAIVTTGSEVGLVGFPGHSAYCASKGAVTNFTRAIALELIPHGIRVNCLAPGLTATTMSDNTANLTSNPEAMREAWKTWAPATRASHPDEHARAVLYLMRDATFSVGSVLVQDGGFTAR